MSASTHATPQNVATIQGKYRPIFELGRGGMANVILAVVQGPGGFNKLQVIKQLRSELALDPEFLTMFLDEARLSARINHSNVVQTNEVGHDGRHYFIAMEYLEGQSLEAFLRRAHTMGGLPLQMFLKIIVDSLEGLHYAHELADFEGNHLHVVHRDVSPQNIFVTYDGVTKVLDFGIAKAADSSSDTRTGVVKGKVAYMAPEQLRGGRKIDRRADVFAVGAILWRAITGKRLWKGLTDLEVFQHLAKGEIPSPATVNPNADPQLVAMCMKAMAIAPDDRYPTAEALRADLERYLDTMGTRLSNREIGKLLADLFAERRKEVKTAIEAQLRASPNAGPSLSAQTGEIPILNNSLMPRMGDSSPSRAALTSDASGSAPMPPLGSTTRSEPDVMARPQDRRGIVLAAMGVGVLVAAIVVSRLVRPAETSTTGVTGTTPTTLSTPVTTQTSSPHSTQRELVLTVDVTPTSARIFVDDEPLISTSTRPQATFVRDSAKHWVRAEAQGYVPKARLVAFDAPTVNLQFTLDPTNPKGPR